jgi:hypothetical protein
MPARRSVALTAAALTLSLAAPAFAHEGHEHPAKPQIVDPLGDGRVPGAGADVVSALFATEGTTAKVRGKQVYTPTRLVVTVKYAGAVAEDPYVTHQVLFQAPGCGEVYLEVYAGGTYGTKECVAGGSFEFSAKRTANALTYSVPFGLVGRSYLKPGKTLTGLLVYTAAGEPQFGSESEETARPVSELVAGDDTTLDGTVDRATTTATFTIG